MQGLESLNQFQNFVSSIGGLGRFEDTYMVHAAEGETVVPMEVLDRNPLLKERLFESMRDMGIQPERYIVGNEFNSLNPLTGQPEFFLKRLKKAIADVSGYAAPIIGAMYGPAAGAAAGAAMGSFKRENPGDPSQWAQMGLRGGASGIASNLASGQKMFTGTGGAGIYDTYNPLTMMSKFAGSPGDMWSPDLSYSTGLGGGGGGEKESFLSKAWSSLKGKSDAEIMTSDLYKKLVEGGTDPIDAIEYIRKGGGGNKLLAGLLGIGGTLGLGKLIGEPEDITVDRSKMYTAPIDTGQVFSPTTPTTVYKDYDIPIAAEGGIIGYHGGGFTGSPHTEGPFYRGEDEGFAPDIPGRPYDIPDKELEMWRDFIFKRQEESQEYEQMEHLRELMKDPEFKQRLMEKMFGAQTMEARHGGAINMGLGGWLKSWFTDPVKDPSTGEGTASTIQRKKFEMLDNLKRSDLPYDEEEYLRLKDLLGKAHGGVMDLRGGGFSQGPGTGTSDSIPAMLSDGEFVMTADAVRGAGGGDRREGARRMYEMMDGLEARA
jgi:hypothetical protein